MNPDNPLDKEDQGVIKNFSKEREQVRSEYNENFFQTQLQHFLRSIPIYLKYKDVVSPEYMDFISYDVFYNEETHIFEKDLIQSMNPYRRILDFGCGVCKLWRNNIEFLEDHSVDCIDLDEKVLAFSKYLLRDKKNVNVFVKNLYDMDLRQYDCILFSEVITRLDDPHTLIKYIIESNPNIRIIVNHTTFHPFVSDILTPIRTNLFGNLPILKTISGRAMTYQQTVELFVDCGCMLVNQKMVFSTKYIFEFQKSLI